MAQGVPPPQIFNRDQRTVRGGRYEDGMWNACIVYAVITPAENIIDALKTVIAGYITFSCFYLSILDAMMSYWH